MKKLYSHFRSLSLLLLCSATIAQCMETQEDKPITWAQTYYGLSEFLIKDIVQLIFSFHLDSSGIDYSNLPALIKKSCTTSEAFVQFIKTLLKSSNATFATEIFERVLTHTKISICDIKGANWKNLNVLHDAVQHKYPEIVKIILNIARDKTWELLTAKEESSGSTPLHLALDNKVPEEIVKSLLKATGDKTETLLTIKDDAGWTALHYAARHGSTEMVKLLLDTAGDNTWILLTKKSDTGNTALHYAANNDSTEIVKLLLNTAGNNAQEFMDIQNRDKKTAFYYAATQTKEVMEKYRKNIQ